MDYASNSSTVSRSITTDTNTVQNSSKLIDFVIRIELTSAILMLKLFFFVKFDDPFCMFLYMVICFLIARHGLVSLPVTSCIKVKCSNLSISN